VVQQITPVKLLVGISESEYTRLHRGDGLTLTADALPGREFTGKVNRIYPTIDPASHTFSAEILVSNGDRVLRPGMYARVKVTFEVRRSIVVPDAAVQKQQGSGVRVVYVVGRNKIVQGGVVEAIVRAKKFACPPNCRRLGKKTLCAELGVCADCDSPDRICKVTAIFDRCPTHTSTLVVIVNENLGY
jgi:hypothetical protein